MTLENLLSRIGTGTKQLTERYSEYPGPVHEHDHHVYYAYEPSAPSHGHVTTPKHSYGGGHKTGASMSALTLLAFLFFLHILQQCIKDHMTEMSSMQPVMVMSGGREGDDIISKSVPNKIDKTGIRETDYKVETEREKINTHKGTPKNADDKNSYDNDDSQNKKQLLKVHTTGPPTSDMQTKHKYAYKNSGNRSSYFSGFFSAMDEE